MKRTLVALGIVMWGCGGSSNGPTPPNDRSPSIILSASYSPLSQFASFTATGSDPEADAISLRVTVNEIVFTSSDAESSIVDSVLVTQKRDTSQSVVVTGIVSANGLSDTSSTDVNIPPATEGAPSISVTNFGDSVVYEGATVVFEFVLRDDFALRSLIIDFGEGSRDTIPLTSTYSVRRFNYTYSNVGSFTFQFTVIDDLGMSTSISDEVVVLLKPSLFLSFIDLHSGVDTQTRSPLKGVSVRLLTIRAGSVVFDTVLTEDSVSIKLVPGLYRLSVDHPDHIPDLVSYGTPQGDFLRVSGVAGPGMSVRIPQTDTLIGYLFDNDISKDSLNSWLGHPRVNLADNGGFAHRYEPDNGPLTLWFNTTGWSTEDLAYLQDFVDLYRSCQDMRVFGDINITTIFETRNPNAEELLNVMQIWKDPNQSTENVAISQSNWTQPLGKDNPSVGVGFLSFKTAIDGSTLASGFGNIGLFEQGGQVQLVIGSGPGNVTLSPLSTYLCNALGALPSGTKIQ